MSDAQTKAEERRAKILARSNRKVSAVSAVTEEELVYQTLTEVSGTKSRPLAARRNFISKVQSEGSLEDKTSVDEKEKDDEVNSSKPTSSAPSSEASSPVKEDKEEKEEKEEGKEKKLSAAQRYKEKIKSKLPPKKTIEEIEKEVAENTKKFDEELKKNNVKNDEEKTEKIIKNIEKAHSKRIINSNSILKLFRIFIIILFATNTGYQSSLKNHKLALETLAISRELSSNKPNLSDSFDNFDKVTPEPFDISTVSSSTKPKRTWLQYFQHLVVSQTECSFTVISLVWWISRIFSPLVTSKFKSQQKSSKPMEMILNYLTNGLDEIKQSIINSLGEMSFHFLWIVFSVVYFNHYFSSLINEGAIKDDSSINSSSEL